MVEHVEEEYFCLKWSEHHSNLSSKFATFLSTEALCDVTIACDGLSLKAHKLVLSASSPFFHQLFLDNPSTNPIVILSDLKYSDLKTLIEFMYHGRVNVSENQLSAILKAAENLKIKGLGNYLSSDFKEIHSDHSYVEEDHKDFNPSKLMEQSMTTEETGFAKKLFLENSPEHEDKNIDYDSVHIQLPQSSPQGSPPLEENSSQAYQSFEGVGALQLESLSDSSKRGRKPGSRLCVVCKRVFHSESELEKHMDGHKSTSSFEDSTKSPVLLDLNETKPVTEKNLLKLPLLCSTCAYVMNTLSDAQSHLSSSPSCRTSQFKCLLCPKLFIWPATLMKHFREQHEGPGGITRVARRMWYFCDVCKKPLLSKHALSLHRSKFHGLNPAGSEENLDNCKRGRKRGTRVCGICKRTFLGSEYFAHVQTVHKNISLSDSSVDASTYMSESISMDNESNSTQSAT